MSSAVSDRTCRFVLTVGTNCAGMSPSLSPPAVRLGLAVAVGLLLPIATPWPLSPPSAPVRVAAAVTVGNGELQVVRTLADPRRWRQQRAALATAPGVVAAGRPAATAAAGLQLPDLGASQWPVRTLELEEVHAAGFDGDGVTVAVVDTGVDRDHPALSGRVLAGFDARVGEPGAASDLQGHGTHVAGIVAGEGAVWGVAPAASILPVRALDGAGFGDSADVAVGLLWAVAAGADVVNLSLGSEENDPVLAAAVAEVVADGEVLLVAAAGNLGMGADPPLYPAALPGMLTVAAHDLRGLPARFSSSGQWIDVAAPGVAVVSAWPGGAAVPMSGTSQAAPFVAGAAALAVADGRTPSEASAAVVASAVRQEGVAPSRGGAGNLSVVELLGLEVGASLEPGDQLSRPDRASSWDLDGLWDRARQLQPQLDERWGRFEPLELERTAERGGEGCALPRLGFPPRRAPDDARCHLPGG